MESPLTNRSQPAPSSDRPDAGAPGWRRRWARLVAGLLAIFVFAFGVLPAAQRLGPVRPVYEAIQRSGIDASALFYTETEVSFEAASSIRNALTYPAAGPGPRAR